MSQFVAKREAYAGANIESLVAMLQTARPHKSKAEARFIRQFIDPLGVERDGFGNCILRIPGPGENILWSSHLDTVHHKGGKQNIRKARDIVTLAPGSKSNCLGADDSAGVWLMTEMVRAKKPGLYIFHRAEECGGLGSDYIATHTPNLLDGIDSAIALDRRGFGDVITFQMSRCASDKFAESLAAGLDMNFAPDDTGTFTDTANYTHLIGECTNLSVGYKSQHSHNESLDIGFLCALREKLIALDTSTLVFSREAGAEDWGGFGYGNYGLEPMPDSGAREYTNDSGVEKFTFDSVDAFGQPAGKYDATQETFEQYAARLKTILPPARDSQMAMAELVEKYPDIAAEILESYGMSEDDFLQIVYEYSGTR